MAASEKTVLLTGASAGIGRHAALALLARGHTVIATGRNESALDELRTLAHAAGHGARLHCERLDLDLPESIEALAARVAALTDGAGVDVLVNNAGYATAGPLAELSDRALRAQFETNVFGLMALTRAMLPAMFARGTGRVVNVSSVSGRVPAPMLGAYHASKYALEALSDALRMELAPFGIGVVIVEPGTIRTNFAARALGEVDRDRRDDTRYGSVYARQAELTARFDRLASGPEPVTRALVRAVEARDPPARIVAPRRFSLLIAAVRVLPTRWVDAAMQRAAGLVRGRV